LVSGATCTPPAAHPCTVTRFMYGLSDSALGGFLALEDVMEMAETADDGQRNSTALDDLSPARAQLI
jgi:hypothetical protein